VWALRRRASGAPILLLSLPLLGVARLLPAHGFGLWLRLVAASLVLLLPGALIARALRLRGASATVAWGLGALGPALLLVFIVHSSILLALAVLGAVGLVTLPFALRVVSGPPAWDTLAIAFVGLAFGVALWHVAGVVSGDALFHLGRVQKLYSFGDLHVRSVDEFADGGLHPGYAFPLWHAFLALVAKVGGVGPTQVMLHEPSAIAPVAFAVVYEAGLALFRSAWLGAAVLTAAVTVVALAPGHGGSFALLSQPGTLDRHVLVAVALTLFFLFLRHPGWALGLSLAAIGVEVLLVHTSTAVFLGVPLLGFAVARVLLTRTDARSSAKALAALFLPAGAALAWLLPLVRETKSHSPPRSELERAFTKYAGELNVDSLHHYALRPEVISRAGAVAVAGLVLAPLAAFAARQRWAAFVLGGTLAVLGIELIPWVFPHFADAVSISQARRLAGFVPIPFALAGGAAVLTGMAGPFVLPAALGAGIALQLAFPGDFGPGLEEGGPAWATWIAAIGGVLAIVIGLRRERRIEARTWIVTAAVILFCLPVAVHGFGDWSAAASVDRHALTPGLLQALRTEVPERAVVFSDLETSYRIGAYAAVYVAAAPPAHVADTPSNHPYRRRLAVNRFFATGNLSILDPYHADSTSRFPGSWSTRIRATRSTIDPDESPPGDDVLPAVRRGRSTAATEVRNAPARARDRDTRARARRREVDPLGPRPRAADPGLDPPRPLSRAPLAQARRRAARATRARPAVATGALAVSSCARAGRERRLEPDGDSGSGSHRARRRDRRGAHDLTAELGASHRRRGEADHRRALGR
jgi:hypothetical protein